jgi:large subunit ribosomal protein L3
MKKFILGTKQKMTQIFDSNGNAYPVTVVLAPESTVIQIKNKETDGYEALQVGFGEKKESRVKKPQKGHFKDLGSFQYVREFKVANIADFKVGDKIGLSTFAEGDKVQVSGISKGKGFQGVVKRHGFGGGRRSHGQKHSEREAGSIGGGGRAGGRVVKVCAWPAEWALTALPRRVYK